MSNESKKAQLAGDPVLRRNVALWKRAKRRTRNPAASNPAWVKMADFTSVCEEVVAKGPGFEIDHIIPFRGKFVSGLHVPNNVQVIPTDVNKRKYNSFEV